MLADFTGHLSSEKGADKFTGYILRVNDREREPLTFLFQIVEEFLSGKSRTRIKPNRLKRNLHRLSHNNLNIPLQRQTRHLP